MGVILNFIDKATKFALCHLHMITVQFSEFIRFFNSIISELLLNVCALNLSFLHNLENHMFWKIKKIYFIILTFRFLRTLFLSENREVLFLWESRDFFGKIKVFTFLRVKILYSEGNMNSVCCIHENANFGWRLAIVVFF